MKKTLSIVSAILIGISSVNFLLIPIQYDDRINELRKENDNLVAIQRDALNFLIKANSQKELQSVLNDHMDILKLFYRDLNYLKKKEHFIIIAARSAAIYAVDACLSVKNITEIESDSILNNLGNMSDLDQLREIYSKYAETASNGTIIIEKQIRDNQQKTDELISNRDCHRYISLFIQSLGLIFGIIAIGMKDISKQ